MISSFFESSFATAVSSRPPVLLFRTFGLFIVFFHTAQNVIAFVSRAFQALNRALTASLSSLVRAISSDALQESDPQRLQPVTLPPTSLAALRSAHTLVQIVARLAQRAILPALPLVDGSSRPPQENLEAALSEAAEALSKGGSCRDVEAILLRAVGDCGSALLLPPCICLHVAAGRRVRHCFTLCDFFAFYDSPQVFSARFRVMNPYAVPIENVTLTLACSVLKVH